MLVGVAVLVVVNAVSRGIVGLLETVGTPLYVAAALTSSAHVRDEDWQQVSLGGPAANCPSRGLPAPFWAPPVPRKMPPTLLSAVLPRVKRPSSCASAVVWSGAPLCTRRPVSLLCARTCVVLVCVRALPQRHHHHPCTPPTHSPPQPTQDVNEFYLALGCVGLVVYAALAANLIRMDELTLLTHVFLLSAVGCGFMVRGC